MCRPHSQILRTVYAHLKKYRLTSQQNLVYSTVDLRSKLLRIVSISDLSLYIPNCTNTHAPEESRSQHKSNTVSMHRGKEGRAGGIYASVTTASFRAGEWELPPSAILPDGIRLIQKYHEFVILNQTR